MPLEDELKLSVAFESNEVLTDTPSIQKRRAFAIRNHKRNISRQELIEEQRIDWKRCEFVKSCIKRNISLNDNAEQNKKKLFI
ncbi:30285_t:CDS:2 [Gigaspora margarita]|uniref:30285_t:CDS:1 n=1 Tax=Gigaspora margarita TaxID=4874 RepID=A0ABN7W223_GIGMA|nr:30285_t:CDS:2 [Gigaspora margarita]